MAGAGLSPGDIRLASRRPKLTVDIMVAGAVTQAGGAGGWEIVARPFRTGFVDWTGREPLTLTIPVLFDGHATRTSVEKDIKTLERLALPHGDNDPPTLRATGPIPHRDDHDWVINGLEWGESIWWRDTDANRAYRTRQACTITLLQLVADDRLERLARRGGRSGKSKRQRSQPYHAKKGDTLISIAAAKLGAAKRWKEIAKLNPRITDPKHLKIGQEIKLP